MIVDSDPTGFYVLIMRIPLRLQFMVEQKGYEGLIYEKLCSIMCSPAGLDLKILRALVKNPKYICKECGRAAVNEYNLCSPEKL